MSSPSAQEIFVGVYVLVALFFMYLGSSQSLALRTDRNVRQLWLPMSVLYLLAAVSALVQGDIVWVRWARSFAHGHNTYDQRRIFQIISLAVLVLLAGMLWKRLHSSTSGFTLRSVLLLGAGGTLVLHALRYVSFHYTDQVLHTVWLHHSVATWIECASLGVMGAGTGLQLLRSYGNV